MPVMDGIRLVRDLRAAPLLADIPVILTSAVNVPQNLPVDAFLCSPLALVDSVKQEVRFTDKHLGRSAEVFVAASGGHGCRSVRGVSG